MGDLRLGVGPSHLDKATQLVGSRARCRTLELAHMGRPPFLPPHCSWQNSQSSGGLLGHLPFQEQRGRRRTRKGRQLDLLERRLGGRKASGPSQEHLRESLPHIRSEQVALRQDLLGQGFLLPSPTPKRQSPCRIQKSTVC